MGCMDDNDQNYRGHKRAYAKTLSTTRCQGISKNGEQCVYEQVPGHKYCNAHMRGVNSITALEKRQYNVDKWKAKIKEKTDTNSIYNLREDIGIIRVVMETTLNKCQTDDDLLMRAPAILDTVTRLERLITSSVKLEERLRSLLDIHQVAMFAEATINAVNDALNGLDMSDEDKTSALDYIANRLEAALPKVL